MATRDTETTVAAMSSGAARVLVPLFSTLASSTMLFVLVILIYYVRFRRHGRIMLGNGLPGAFDDAQQAQREEEMYLHTLDDQARQQYFQAKAFQEANPPDSANTDISLSQFMSIQEKGVSAWEFEPDLEATTCFVECRTELAFYDQECSVQTNLPIPKQNDVYYWEAKLYDFPESTIAAIGVATKPYPAFRLPGYNRHSVGYLTDGTKRRNQPFFGKTYGPVCRQGDVIGCGYKPRTGTVFFTRNGKKLEEAATGYRQNIFPSVGANGPCQIHVNFGQAGFVFIEANVKKWGLAPMNGTLAPPPAYGSSEITDSVLLAAGFSAQRSSAEDRHGSTGSLLDSHPDDGSVMPYQSDISLATIAPRHHGFDAGQVVGPSSRTGGPPSYTSEQRRQQSATGAQGPPPPLSPEIQDHSRYERM
ncbi:concanavalin A-like lectin/glucanase domain-containing protein [Protomyces lactucae-debilis]|uniref:Concanavalin A-like lectin/glucanase domain-containing protein n=1 Tax=Protomyces lactucae-debilis TaxID=2754530 RepID=A0A1Y2FQI6_PROLT|nr:concanavalin A-like lectin/glucanase domain-containing protein [Protomyces lactucae-debilis]ORY86261.1 concanavalin A-like lectin/glucanase domain-containing protein [Protomyces lactucae-debilis]